MAVSDLDLGGLVSPLGVLPRRSLLARANLNIWLPVGVFGLLLLGAFVAPSVFHIPGPNTGSLFDTLKPPFTRGHLLGTTNLGNDMLSQCLYGARITLEVSFAAVGIGYVVGGSIGAIAGYVGGLLDTIVMRVLDMVLAFPFLVLAMTIVTFLGSSERNLILTLAFVLLPSKARIARAVTLKMRQRDFILASRLLGKKPRTIIIRHLIPNIAPTLMTFAFLNLSTIMIVMASLSYLGLGLPPSVPSWGYLISQGQGYLVTDPWMALIPGAFLFATIMSLNALSDNLRTRFKV